MSTYIIGDVQGCFDALMELTDVIQFNPQHDQLIFCGDLVNRGGQSLDVLRWVYAHQSCCDSVLGNHDLSLLRKYYSKKRMGRNKEFNQIFKAPDVTLLMNWLLNRPFYIRSNRHVVVHAGIYPFWTYKQFKELAAVTHKKMVDDPKTFFSSMYGNTPKKWSADLPEMAMLRFVVNEEKWCFKFH
jgi:bis(5'-nucleosyl)-tetraphosphatase (symmetrical)